LANIATEIIRAPLTARVQLFSHSTRSSAHLEWIARRHRTL